MYGVGLQVGLSIGCFGSFLVGVEGDETGRDVLPSGLSSSHYPAEASAKSRMNHACYDLDQHSPCSQMTVIPTRLLSTSTSALSSLASAAGTSTRSLPPIQYHIFAEPLPYPIGLRLQNEIIDRRLAARANDPKKGRQDILLLLGEPRARIQAADKLIRDGWR